MILNLLAAFERLSVLCEAAQRDVEFEPAVRLGIGHVMKIAPPVEQADGELEVGRPAVGHQENGALEAGVGDCPEIELLGESLVQLHDIVRLLDFGERELAPVVGRFALRNGERLIPDILGVGVRLPAVEFARLEIIADHIRDPFGSRQCGPGYAKRKNQHRGKRLEAFHWSAFRYGESSLAQLPRRAQEK